MQNVVIASDQLDTQGYRKLYRASGQENQNLTVTGALSRILDINKKSATTGLRISYRDIFGFGPGATAEKYCIWEIKIDGTTCAPHALKFWKFESYLQGNNHQMDSFVGTCENIASGNHRIQVFVTEKGSNSCYTGHSMPWYLEAEEVR